MRPLKKRPYAIIFPEAEGRTEQSHKNDCDINVIMQRALRGQASPYVREDMGSYGDATTVSFHEANNIVANAKSMFEELPSKIRTRFHNDPGEFQEFIQDDSNRSEAEELGLVKKKPKTPDTIETSSLEEKEAQASSEAEAS